MKTSDKGKNIIKEFEELRLEAYLDAVGIPTIGWGHTRGVKMGQVITLQQAEDFLLDDLREAELAVTREVYVNLTQNMFDALVSLIFNIGIGNFRTSTLLRKLNAGDVTTAANEFNKWVYAKKKKLKGLVRRRAKERLLFIS